MTLQVDPGFEILILSGQLIGALVIAGAAFGLGWYIRGMVERARLAEQKAVLINRPLLIATGKPSEQIQRQEGGVN